MKLCMCLLICLGVLLGTTAFAASAAPGYHVVKKIPIGGDGRWDIVAFDSATHRFYVGRSDRMMVIDVDKGVMVGELANTPGIHAIALVPKLDVGFTTNGGDNTVTVFDLKTLKEKQRISVGQKPDAIVYDPTSKRIFTMNAGSLDATAIDVEAGKVVGTVPLGGKPEFAVSGGKGRMFVNIEDKSEIVEFDSRTLTVKNHWSIAPAQEPSGLAFDRKNHRLFFVGSNQMMAVVDSETGKVITTVPIGKGSDGAEFDASEMLAFSPNGQDGTMTVVKEEAPDKFTVAETVPTQVGARTMVLDPKTHTIYLPTAKFATPVAGEAPKRRPDMEPNSFMILVVGK